jgi:NAD(P)H-hydrate epimerase
MKASEQEALEAGARVEDLMERAGQNIAIAVAHFIEHCNLPKKVVLLAGKGNNGGDGFTAGRELLKRGFSVHALMPTPPEKDSLCARKKEEFSTAGGSFIEEVEDGVYLDALFGIGFEGKMEKKIEELIKTVNISPFPVLSIDIPSGLDADSGRADCVIDADMTLAIEFPKIGSFFGEGWNHVGKIQPLPIGLRTSDFEFLMLEPQDVAPLLPKIDRRRHKYEAGHVVGLAGSPGMCGAAMMASWSALRAGAGIVHLITPKEALGELSGPPWEVVRVPYTKARAKELLNHAKSVFVGPGLGLSKMMSDHFADYKEKAIIDADGLNFLAKRKKFGKLPHAILSPHIGEMRRLLDVDKEMPLSPLFLKLCEAFSQEHATNLILKGGPTFIFAHDAPACVMPFGDPGMATAGSGDVLTGILAALRAQGMQPYEAALLGTSLHAIAGEAAAAAETSYCMTATSIINFLPQAFHHMQHIEQLTKR